MLLDPKTCRPVRVTRLKPRGDAAEALTFSDYRTANGLTLPHRVTFSFGSQITEEMVFDRLEPNPVWPSQDKEP